MKWIMLLVLFSCASNKPTASQEGKAAEVSAVTESEAKPVSPLTVKPCFCMKIFKPVCANGVSYGNSCEAECNGNKTWKDGPCPKKDKK